VGNSQYKNVKIGAKFHNWTVVSSAYKNKHKKTTYPVVCVCGTRKDIPATVLANGRSKSCGCLGKDFHKITIGSVFGAWTVTSEPIFIDGVRMAGATCKCGVSRDVVAHQLLSGASKSCGCLRSRALLKANTRHGKSSDRIYSIWCAMLSRCTNEKCKEFQIYGARGISVCDRWKSFDCFYEDMGDCPSDSHSIDRIDNDGDYKLENCRWATQSEQCRNKGNNITFMINGERKTLVEISEDYNMNYSTLYSRIRSGFSISDALTKPKGYKRAKRSNT